MQNWNDILTHIKLNFGTKLNKLEFDDDELIEYLKTQVLPEFSQWCPHKKEAIINSTNIIDHVPGQNRWIYKIPVEENEYIVDIFDVYMPKSSVSSAYDDLYKTDTSYYGMIDTVIYNTYQDIARSLLSRNTWEFKKPDMISFDSRLEGDTIVVYNTSHEDLSTISPDMYHRIFKTLCLAHVQKWVVSLRSKYRDVNTPWGPITMDLQRLEQEARENFEYVNRLLNELPPDHFIYIDV